MLRTALYASMAAVCLAFAFAAPADGQQSSSLAGSTWSGHEGLQGYGALAFRFASGGGATMLDTDGSTSGSWSRSGRGVTLKFYNNKVVYTGTINGFRMHGTATNGKKTWNWWVLKPTTDLKSTTRDQPVDAPKRSTATNRKKDLLNEVINQFDVENNPRYANAPGLTYCNIFVTDVTRALGAEIPHNVGGKEQTAALMRRWMNNQGRLNGWRMVSAAEAKRSADAGRPAIVYGSGHIAVVRPGGTAENPAIAQAGKKIGNNLHVNDGVWEPADLKKVEYFVHD